MNRKAHVIGARSPGKWGTKGHESDDLVAAQTSERLCFLITFEHLNNNYTLLRSTKLTCGVSSLPAPRNRSPSTCWSLQNRYPIPIRTTSSTGQREAKRKISPNGLGYTVTRLERWRFAAEHRHHVGGQRGRRCCCG